MSGQLVHEPRTKVFTALYDLLVTTTPPVDTRWKQTGQYLIQYDQVPPANQPALFLHRGPQIAEQKHVFGVVKWQLRTSVWVYYRVDGLQTASTYPDQLTDQFLDNLELVMQADPTGQQTLGGVCYHAWIDGTCIFDSGVVDKQAVLVIPISILI